MSEYIDLELLKLRAQVLEAAMKSDCDLTFYVKHEFTSLMEDLSVAYYAVVNKEAE